MTNPSVSFISISKILIEDRQRKEFDEIAMKDLAISIEQFGLLNPITLLKIEETSDETDILNVGKEYRLLAGERRLRCIATLFGGNKKLQFGSTTIPDMSIPAIVYSNLDEIDQREIELTENIMRQGLTWQEQTKAYKDIHELRSAQNSEQTMSDTAEEIVRTQGDQAKSVFTTRREISQANVVADYLDDPDIAKAASAREAFKLVTKKIEQELHDKRMSKPVFEKSSHLLYNKDFRSVPIKPNSISCVVTDPPYGIGVANFGGAQKKVHKYEETNIEQLHALLLSKLGEVCNSEAHAYVFCDFEFFYTLRNMFINRGWNTRRTPLIWSKGNKGHLADGDVFGYRRTSETILFAWRGKRKCSALLDDILTFPVIGEQVHAAQKPVALYSVLLKQSAEPGDTVLDPFAGSCPILDAATEHDMKAIAIELNEEYARAAERIRGVEINEL